MADNKLEDSRVVSLVLVVLAAVAPPLAVVTVIGLFENLVGFRASNDGFDLLYISVGLAFLVSIPLGIFLGSTIWQARNK